MQPHFHTRDLRLGRFSQPDQIYLVTAVTLNRQPIFASFAAARILIEALRAAQTSGRAETLAFVVMPDHLHWLLGLGTVADLTAVVQLVKSVSAHRVGGKVWQRGFHDRAIRREEDLPAVARYVVANPVRAGLVQRVGAYSHWDAVWV
jgi:REP element-mobilizing transposase RayT